MAAKGVIGAFCAVAVANATVAQAKDDEAPIVLDPAGPWQLDMAENKCRIARLFGAGERRALFYLEQWSPDEVALWTVAGEDFKRFRDWRDTTFIFGPGGQSGEFKFVKSTFGEFGAAINHQSALVPSDKPDFDWETHDYTLYPHGLPALDADAAEGVTTLSLTQKNRATVSMNLGDMKAPLSAMNHCMEDLVETWGFDPEEQKTVQSPPRIENLVAVAREIQERYPSSALNAGHQADFHVRLTISAAGQIETCVLLNQTLAEGFDMKRGPCAAFERIAEIEPARTKGGEAVRSYYTTRIVYRIG